MFVKEQYQSLEKSLGHKIPLVPHIIAEKWATQKFEDRLVYFEIYDKEVEEYSKIKEDFLSKLSMEEKRVFKAKLVEIYRQRRKILAKIRLKREKKNMNRPVRPAHPFISFYLECRNKRVREDTRHERVQDYSREIGIKWWQLDEGTKQKYHNEYKKQVEEYKNKTADWESRMIIEGRAHLLLKNKYKLIKKNLNKKKIITAKQQASKLKRKITRFKNKAYRKKLKERKADHTET